MANLSVNLCGVTLKNPVIAASGTFGFGREFDELYDIGRLGGVSTKGLTMEPRLGNPVPRIAESRGVILNAVGLQNPGVEHFIKYDFDWLKAKGTAVVANVAGKTLEDYAAICARLDGLADIIELNISWSERPLGRNGVRNPPRERERGDKNGKNRPEKDAFDGQTFAKRGKHRRQCPVRRKKEARTAFRSSIPLRA